MKNLTYAIEILAKEAKKINKKDVIKSKTSILLAKKYELDKQKQIFLAIEILQREHLNDEE